MTYLFINPDNEYPRHQGDILLDDPSWDGTIENLPNGWKPVTPVEPPTVTALQTIEEDFPKLINKEYFQVWKVRDLTEKEIEQNNEVGDNK